LEFNKQFSSVKASIEMEGFTISKQVEKLVVEEVSGEISFEEFTEQMKQIVQNKK